ncbi:hypothetical protein [Morganella morganii]|uniref:hypothetical protein n=1 Tax=Morganella morganii TaxID=582 RepID=UPI001FFD6D4E|nr:hypothetical protein [Morganella morganii]
MKVRWRGDADNRHLNRIAGIYVQGDNGKLTLNAKDSVTPTAKTAKPPLPPGMTSRWER